MDASRDEQGPRQADTPPASPGEGINSVVVNLLKAALGVWNAFRPTLEALAKTLPDSIVELEDAAVRKAQQSCELGEAGWCLPGSEGFDFVSSCHKILVKDSDGAAKLDQKLIEEYAVDGELYRRLRDDLSGDAIPDRFRGLLRDCLKAHEEGLYYVAITGLFAIIEGLMAEGTGNSKKKQTSPIAALDRLEGESDGLVNNIAMFEGLRTFLETTYGGLSFEGAHPSLPHRHWILHGRLWDFGKEPNSLRLLMAASSISMYFEVREEMRDLRPTGGAAD